MSESAVGRLSESERFKRARAAAVRRWEERSADERGQSSELVRDDVCGRCGASMQATHHPLCEERDGTPTRVPDDVCSGLVRVLRRLAAVWRRVDSAHR